MTASSVVPTSIAAALAIEGGAARVVGSTSGPADLGYGGHTMALALTAAYETVPDAFAVRHVHVDFLRPAQVGRSVGFRVERVRDGRSTAHRRVEVVDELERVVVTAQILFRPAGGTGAGFARPLPAGPARSEAVPVPIHHSEVLVAAVPGEPARQRVWMRPQVRPLPADPRLHEAAMLFMADVTVLWSAVRVHGLDPLVDRRALRGTVAHSMWFHRSPDVDDWLCYDQVVAHTAAGLCHAEGRLYGADGTLVASVAQTGLLDADLLAEGLRAPLGPAG
jgi:acyl-CoA thioesterase-2